MKRYILLFLLIFVFLPLSNFKIEPSIVLQPSIANPPQGSIFLGEIEGNKEIRIVINLKLKESNYLENLARNSSFSFKKEMLESFLPSEKEYEKILNFVNKANPSNVTIYKGSLALAFTAKASKIEELFKVKFYEFYYKGEIFYYSTSPILDSSIAKDISAIFGLSDFKKFKKSSYFSSSIKEALTVDQVRAIYGIDKLLKEGFNGTGQTIVIASVNLFSKEDLATFFSTFKIPQIPIEVIEIFGYSTGIESETIADIQWARAIAPGAKIILATIPDPRLASFNELFNYIISKDLGKIISTSWVIEEELLNDEELEALHELFLLGVAKGMNFFFPSGDWGSSNTPKSIVSGKNISRTIPYYPATEPFAISVGGTELVFEGNGYYEEAWGGMSASGTYGSGGGYSNYFPRPFYQGKEIGNMRGFPDVSYNAGYPYVVVIGGKFQKGIGTSLSTPQWAALAAILAQMSNSNIGFLNYRLYQIYYSSDYQRLFNDITKGNNGYYNASKGWDPVTGLGSPKAYDLIHYLASKTKRLYILTTSSDRLKIYINGSIHEIPTTIEFKNDLNLKIKLNDTIYISKDIRYVYNRTIGTLNTTSDEFNLTLKDSSNLIIVYYKEYFINATANLGFAYGTGWYREGSIANIITQNPFSLFFEFKGWKGDVNSSSQVLTLKVYKSYRLIADWEISIRGIALFFGMIAALILAIYLLLKEHRRPQAIPEGFGMNP